MNITSRNRLVAAVSAISDLLASLGLTLHPKKTKITPITEPVCFLGAVVYPHYRHSSSRTTHKFLRCRHAYQQICEFAADEAIFPSNWVDMENIQSSMNSYLGYLRHFKAGKLSML